MKAFIHSRGVIFVQSRKEPDLFGRADNSHAGIVAGPLRLWWRTWPLLDVWRPCPCSHLNAAVTELDLFGSEALRFWRAGVSVDDATKPDCQEAA